MTSDEIRSKLFELFEPIDGWAARVDGQLDVEKGSSLLLDDVEQSLWPVSYLVTSSMLYAVDHLRCLADSMRSQRGIYVVAYDSLLRGALVAATQAVWVMDGPNRQVRRLRALLVYRDDWFKSIAVTKAAKKSGIEKYAQYAQSDLEKWQERLDATAPILEKLKRSAGKNAPGDYTMTNTVLAVAKTVFDDGTESGKLRQLGLRWILGTTSAAAHATPGSALSRVDRKTLEDLGGGLARSSVSADVTMLFASTASVVYVLNEAWRLYDQRRVRRDSAPPSG